MGFAGTDGECGAEGHPRWGSQEYDALLKWVIVGTMGAGKTSFMFRLADDTFVDRFTGTIGIDFRHLLVGRNHKCLKLQVWDTSGRPEVRGGVIE